MKRTLFIGITLFTFAFAMQSCIIEGCTDEDAANYDSAANEDDGSCYYEGEAVFWTDDDYGVGNISVYVGGTYEGQITGYYDYAPACNASSAVTVTRSPGTHYFTASATGTTWEGSIYITTNGCYTMRLYVNKDGNAKSEMVERTTENAESTLVEFKKN